MAQQYVVSDQDHELYEGVVETYGLGWGLTTYKGEQLFGHNGGQIGFSTEIKFLPQRKWGSVIFTNSWPNGNNMNTILAMGLIDDFLSVAKEKRFNHEKKARAIYEQNMSLAKDAPSKLYPSAPTPALPPSPPLQAHTGTFTHPGYQMITISLSSFSKSSKSTDDKKQEKHCLNVDFYQRTWPLIAHMEHVAGNFWITYCMLNKQAFPFKTEFRAGVDGRMAKVGIRLESAMQDNEVIWFVRQK
ncbi:hypothetical protein MMC25_000478 [Agyrium rufum]|nr:hypothetical protein [Agyrium rufum]